MVKRMSTENSNIWTDKDIAINDKHEALFLKKKRKALLRSEDRRRKNELREINRENRYSSEIAEIRSKKRTTTKVLMYCILINCSVIEIYSMIAMVVLSDLSSLYSLIGAVVSESISYAIYCCKSFNDTKEEQRSKLERDKWEADQTTASEDNHPDIDELDEDPVPDDDDHSGDIPDDVIMEESEDIDNGENS